MIIPDNDEPGRRHAAAVARSLDGIAASVKVLELPGVPAKGDVSDWIAVGGTAEGLKQLAKAAPYAAEWLAGRESESEKPENEPHGMTGPRADVVCLADVEREAVSWLWDYRVPFGKLTLLDGDPGLGKSTLALEVAARLFARGGTPGRQAA